MYHDGDWERARMAKMTRASFDAQRGPQGALLVGDPDEVAREDN